MSGNKSPIDIRVLSQDGSVVVIRMPTGMIMRTLFKSYCKKKQIIDYNTVQFLFDGVRILPTTTIDELGLIDGDQIDAMLHQTGGGFTN